METKLCLECQVRIIGRSDKRFCDDSCRNTYNNRLNSDQTNLVRLINNLLRKNRRILEEILGSQKMVKESLKNLQKKGFNFDYHTHRHQTNKGHVYIFVYEYGYLPLENNIFLIVKQNVN